MKIDYEKERQNILDTLYDALKTMKDGEETTAYTVCKVCFPDLFEDGRADEDLLTQIDSDLAENAEEYGLRLDKGKYMFTLSGLPYNIPFGVYKI